MKFAFKIHALMLGACIAVFACNYSIPGGEVSLVALVTAASAATSSAAADPGTTPTTPTTPATVSLPDIEAGCENSSGKCMFIAGSISGNFGPIPLPGPHPITKIDNYCESNKGALTGTYRAFIVDGQSDAEGRIAAAGSQHNWVLQANTAYYRQVDFGLIGVTNANALFDFPLTRSFDTSGEVWTGLTNTWAAGALLCDTGGGDVWDSFGDTGEVGDLTSTSNTALFNGVTSCGNSRRILCVQQ